MLKRNLAIAIRNLIKNKAYSLVNIFGLAVGLACCLLLLLYVKDELTFDRFHQDSDLIYRVASRSLTSNGENLVAAVPKPAAPALIENYPEVIDATRLSDIAPVVSYREKRFNETRFFFADANFFDFFTVPLLKGNPKTVLRQPNSVVITDEMAQKYFGEEDPIGKTITVSVSPTYMVNFTTHDFIISGVSRRIPSNSHFHFDFLASFATLGDHFANVWIGGLTYTYIKLRKDHSPQELEAKFPQFIRTYLGPYLQTRFGMSYDDYLSSGRQTDYFLQPLTDIHFHSNLNGEIEPGGDVRNVYLLSAISIFIVLLACINYVNLAIARAARRAKEVGVRKILGGQRAQLVVQFLTESSLMTLAAFILALVFIDFALAPFNALSGTELQTLDLIENASLFGLLAMLIIVSLLAGSYPAFFLSGFRLISVLNRKLQVGSRKNWLGNGLVILQFTVSITLIVATIVIYHQKEFMMRKDPGLQREQVVIIHQGKFLGEKPEAFKEALLSNAHILDVSFASSVPGIAESSYFDKLTFKHMEDAGADEPFRPKCIVTRYDFLETFGMQLVAGRTFSTDFGTDSLSIIINQTAAEMLGGQNALGKKFRFNDKTLTVIGIVKDFQYQSLHYPLEPLVILMPEAFSSPNHTFAFVAVRIDLDEISDTLGYLETQWRMLAPNQPFKYSFMEDDFKALYRKEQKAGQIFGIFSSLAIFIACLGLFGLAAFTTEQRTKEIGVRKVLGATVASVTALLSKDFVKPVLLANVIAWPVAWYAMNRWLQNFAYRIDIGWWVFVLAGGLALLIALVTVITHAIRAALANPVESLRYE